MSEYTQGSCKCRPLNDHEIDTVHCEIHDIVNKHNAMVGMEAAEFKPILGLTFAELRAINGDRCRRWHYGGEPWISVDWSNAVAGEAGELCNKVKKLRRLETAVDQHGVDESSSSALLEQIAEEIADVVLYCDLTADFFGLSLEEIVKAKFNKVSDKRGYPHKL